MARFLRLLAALGLFLGVSIGVLGGSALPAYAADDQIDSFTIDYRIGTDGVLHATETIVWRFGSNSGRHGIKREFVTREKYDDANDAVYGISQISVKTSPGVSNTFTSSTSTQQGGRFETTEVKIGDPDKVISAPTATYTISYQVTGALRSFDTATPPYDEFFWDATGSGNPAIKKLAVTVEVPGGAQGSTCFAGPVSTSTPCQIDKFSKGGAATFGQDNLAAHDNVSIGVKIAPGLIADNKPHLQPDGSKLTRAEKIGLAVLGGVGLLIVAGSPLVGWLWWRKNGRDQRYVGLAPGTTPLPGQQVAIAPNDPDLPIPVAFSPPKIPVAEAGLLIDGQVDTRETAATIVDLAVRGAMRVESQDKNDFRVTLLDPDRATAPHEMVLLTSLFNGEPPGATRDLSERGSLTTAHNAMRDSVRNQVTARGWFRKVPSATTTSGFGFGIIALGVFGAFSLGAWVLLLLIPVLPIVITVAVIRFKLRRGQRTAEGRAVDDQVEGFKTYLATAEADQLRFEEGEDIFSRYLPWAIAFDLADRWAKVCADLVAAGRIPDTAPSWYVGNYYGLANFNTGFLTSNLTSAATPIASSGSSGSGFGGGSSFGGGGFSGGGGGGGGSSSW